MNNNEKNINETIEIFTDYIDSEGYVLRYNYEKGYYYNTGICLKGSLGNPGRPGRPGKDGDSWDLRQVDGIYYWFKNGINQHIPAQVLGEGVPTGLAPVATTGDYNDLNNKPTIPIKTSLLTNDSGFLTLHQDISGKVDKEIGKGLSTNDYSDEDKQKVTTLDETAVLTNSYDATVAVGLADNLRGDTIVEAEFYKRKTGGTQSVGSGIAAIKEVKGKSIVWNQLLNEGKLVDMGLPSGTLWASCNIDITQSDGFAASPFQYACSFFSWGNVDGHNPISTSAFDYDFGSVNAQEPWYERQPYSETQGNTLTGNIPVGDTYDAARVNVGTLWRMPTSAEFAELFANIRYINADGTEVDTTKTDKRVNVNGVMGLYLESRINGARLFFSCSGNSSGTSWYNRGSYGYYWSASFYSARGAHYLLFDSGGVNPQSDGGRCSGFALRPVINKTVIDNGKGGHKYAQYKNNVSDLTLMFGAGNEPNSVAEFEKMFPLDYYDYNEGEVIPFAGQNLVTTGFNQWDGEWESGSIDLATGVKYAYANAIRSENFIPIFPNTAYFYKSSLGCAVYYYDADKKYLGQSYYGSVSANTLFTTPAGAYYMLFRILATTYNHDICINISNPDRNGTYEPYEKHTLPLDPPQWRDKNGDLVFPYGGMHGVGTAYDYAKVDADGYIRKAIRCFGQVDCGTLGGYFKPGGNTFQCIAPENCKYGNGYCVCGNYQGIYCGGYGGIDKTITIYNNLFIIVDSGKSNLSAADFKAAMNGVIVIYELAEPVEIELATPVYAKYLVDKDGTEEITPANGSTPYTTMANLSILYAMDARGEIKNLPKNYLSKESTENMLNAMVSADIIASYTMTYDAANGRYTFVITKPAEASANSVNNESNI